MLSEDAKISWHNAWELLKQATENGKHPFSTPVIATSDHQNRPFTRTVVLRKVLPTAGELWCYTDRRSAKAKHLAEGSPYVSWTFWSPDQQLQINCSGPAHWLPEDEAKAVFTALPRHSRKAYASLAAPGTPQATASDGLPDDWTDRSVEQTDYAANNFGILSTKVTRSEVLQLRREGHRRLLAIRNENDVWQFSWVVP